VISSHTLLQFTEQGGCDLCPLERAKVPVEVSAHFGPLRQRCRPAVPEVDPKWTRNDTLRPTSEPALLRPTSTHFGDIPRVQQDALTIVSYASAESFRLTLSPSPSSAPAGSFGGRRA